MPFACDPPRCLRPAKQALDLPPIKADDHLSVDDGHWGRLVSELQELLQRRRISPDVPVGERNFLMRKKLFLRLAARSPRLAINNDFFRHHILLCSLLFRALSPKKTAAAKITLNANKVTPKCSLKVPAKLVPARIANKRGTWQGQTRNASPRRRCPFRDLGGGGIGIVIATTTVYESFLLTTPPKAGGQGQRSPGGSASVPDAAPPTPMRACARPSRRS